MLSLEPYIKLISKVAIYELKELHTLECNFLNVLDFTNFIVFKYR